MTTTIVTAENNPATDPVNIQNAIDAAGDGDIIQLVNPDDNTPFDLGEATLVVNAPTWDNLTIQGTSIGLKAKIVNGGDATTPNAQKGVLHVANGVGKSLTMKYLSLRDGHSAGFAVRTIKDFIVDHVDMRWDTAEGFTYSNPVAGYYPDLLPLIIGSPSAPFGITGRVDISNMYIDTEGSMDPADPYAGNRSVLNPALVGDGGAWPGPGSSNTGGWGVAMFNCWIPASTAQISVRNCTFKNYTTRGLQSVDPLAAIEWSNNTFISPYGTHLLGSPYGCIEMSGIVGLVGITSPHGCFTLDKNIVINSGKYGLGTMLGNIRTGQGKLKSASCTRNKYTLQDATAAVHLEQHDLGTVANNIIAGYAEFGIMVGLNSPVRIGGTDRNAILNNKFSNFFPNTSTPDADPRHVFLTKDSAENIVRSGESVAGNLTYLDEGENNQIVGLNVSQNEINQDLRDLLNAIQDNPLVCPIPEI